MLLLLSAGRVPPCSLCLGLQGFRPRGLYLVVEPPLDWQSRPQLTPPPGSSGSVRVTPHSPNSLRNVARVRLDRPRWHVVPLASDEARAVTAPDAPAVAHEGACVVHGEGGHTIMTRRWEGAEVRVVASGASPSPSPRLLPHLGSCL
jgi:hypothetical protein